MLKPLKKAACMLLAVGMIGSGLSVPVFADSYSDKLEALVAENDSGKNYVESIKLEIGNNSISVDGEETTVAEPAQLIDGSTMLPARAIIEALGGTADFDKNTGDITFSKDDVTMVMHSGDNDIAVTSDSQTETVTVDTAPQIVGEGTTVVPVRAVSENFGTTVIWNGEDQTVTIIPEYQTKRLIVKSKNGRSLDFSDYDSLLNKVIDDGNGLYILQFEQKVGEATVKNRCEKINSWASVEYAEPDTILFTAAGENGYYTSQADNWSMDYTGIPAYIQSAVNAGKSFSNIKIGVIEPYDLGDETFKPGSRVSRRSKSGTEATTNDNRNHAAVDASIIDTALESLGSKYTIYVYSGTGNSLIRKKGMSTSIAAERIKTAAESGCQVVNMSIQELVPKAEYVSYLRDIIKEYPEILFVAAAGNGRDTVCNTDAAYYPAAFSVDCSNVITVAAVDRNGEPYVDSNYGEGVDLAAPGVDICGRSYNGENGGYYTLSGTSQAAPHVAAAAAVLYAEKGWTGSTLKSALKSGTYAYTPSGWNSWYGVGILKMPASSDNTPTQTPTQTPATVTEEPTQAPATTAPEPTHNTTTAVPVTPAPEAEIIDYEMEPSSDVTLNVGETMNLKVYAKYSDGTRKDVTSSVTLMSLTESVASVNSSGKVTAKSAGSATITISQLTTASYSLPKIKVTVVEEEQPATQAPTTAPVTQAPSEPEITAYEWSESSIELEEGETANLKLYAVYSDGSQKDVTSKTSFVVASGNDVVTISSSGKITAISEGTAKIQMGGLTASSVSMPRAVTVTVTAKMYGDVNGDGKLTLKDISMLNSFIDGTRTPTEQQKKLADVDGNGALNSDDVNLMKRRIVLNQDDPFPVEQ